MAKKKTKRKKPQFRQENKITYNTAKPNRQARRLGIVAVEPPKQEEPKKSIKGSSIKPKGAAGTGTTEENNPSGNDIRRVFGISERKTAGDGR